MCRRCLFLPSKKSLLWCIGMNSTSAREQVCITNRFSGSRETTLRLGDGVMRLIHVPSETNEKSEGLHMNKFSKQFRELWSNENRSLDIAKYELCLSEFQSA